ncbi:MAG: 2-oxoglutarate dehydrogenase E1 component [Deltaproteobacteria bacterium]|nr:2-oxoglutarate dehydrogenase E1 component [Deltaproteobacteria bacterium]
MQNDSLLSGSNLPFLEELYESYQKDPQSVDPSWVPLFKALRNGNGGNGNSNGNGHHEPSAPVLSVSARVDRASSMQARVDDLIHAYRLHGHVKCDLDPLGLTPPKTDRTLDIRYYGFTDQDLGKNFSPDGLPLGSNATLGDIVRVLEETYCKHIGVEYMHILDEAQRNWLQRRMEERRNEPRFSTEEQRRILTKLSYAEGFEGFLHKKYVGAKRFSLSGAETLIPMLDALIELSAQKGVEELVVGMAHRGRLNVLTNIFGKTPAMMFSEFEHNQDPRLTLGSGDVKYHLGFSHDYKAQNGKTVHLTMAFNPSHLEFINPVVEGRVRAKQDRKEDKARLSVMPVLIHGDAAFMGEGVVMETLNLCDLDGYVTGGTVHIVVNNQVGFTTNPSDSRSTRYCTDIAKLINVPIFHVNSDDPDACVYVTKLAMEFRQQFKKDVVIDLVCYRRYGHNEGDEPSFTQPVMYKVIKEREPVRTLYAKQLNERGSLTMKDSEAIYERCMAEFGEQHDLARKSPPPEPFSTLGGVWQSYRGGKDSAHPDVDTNVKQERLVQLAKKLTELPAGFEPHPKVHKLLETRAAMGEGKQALDWGMGEMLAYASLVDAGVRVRITGQDVRRGTFSSRHAVVVDQKTNARHCPLTTSIGKGHLPFELYDSPLSEVGVLGFEFGYSLDAPDSLVVWEAQFGDFVNVAQVIIDQFISSSSEKWKRLNGLVMLLPHGYEGQGPEHSSARLERFMQLASNDNLQICNLTTPAQLFHALRRQVLRPYRKPLVVMTPKSLLRHPEAISPLNDLSNGGFQRVIDDAEVKPAQAKRVMLCSGKVYYDLIDERKKRGLADTAIVRVEQLYPLAEVALKEIAARYKKAKDFLWVQEEPENMGSAFFMQPRLSDLFGVKVAVVSRKSSASPATGSKDSHDLEQALLLKQAFGDAVE